MKIEKRPPAQKNDDNTIYLVDYITKLNRMWTKKNRKWFFCLVLFLVRDIMTHFGIFSFINCNNQHFMISVNWIFFFVSIDIIYKEYERDVWNKQKQKTMDNNENSLKCCFLCCEKNFEMSKIRIECEFN